MSQRARGNFLSFPVPTSLEHVKLMTTASSATRSPASSVATGTTGRGSVGLPNDGLNELDGSEADMLVLEDFRPSSRSSSPFIKHRTVNSNRESYGDQRGRAELPDNSCSWLSPSSTHKAVLRPSLSPSGPPSTECSQGSSHASPTELNSERSPRLLGHWNSGEWRRPSSASRSSNPSPAVVRPSVPNHHVPPYSAEDVGRVEVGHSENPHWYDAAYRRRRMLELLSEQQQIDNDKRDAINIEREAVELMSTVIPRRSNDSIAPLDHAGAFTQTDSPPDGRPVLAVGSASTNNDSCGTATLPQRVDPQSLQSENHNLSKLKASSTTSKGAPELPELSFSPYGLLDELLLSVQPPSPMVPQIKQQCQRGNQNSTLPARMPTCLLPGGGKFRDVLYNKTDGKGKPKPVPEKVDVNAPRTLDDDEQSGSVICLGDELEQWLKIQEGLIPVRSKTPPENSLPPGMDDTAARNANKVRQASIPKSYDAI